MAVLALILVAACAARDDTAEAVGPADIKPAEIIDAMPVTTVSPKYPRKALLECTGGMVDMIIHVDEDGRAQDIDVIRAEPGNLFVEAAADAVFEWRFKPTKVDGKAAPSRQYLHLAFDEPEKCY